MESVWSMAETKSKYMCYLQEHSSPWIFHLLFLYFYPDHFSYDYWRGDSFKFVPSELFRFKGTNRFPSFNFIYHNLFEAVHDSDGLMKNFKDKIRSKGLVIPNTFDMVYWDSIEKMKPLVSEVCGVLAMEHRITRDNYLSILTKHGL